MALKEAFGEFVGSVGPSDRVGHHDGVRIRSGPEERADVDHAWRQVRVTDHVGGRVGVDHLPWMIERYELRRECVQRGGHGQRRFAPRGSIGDRPWI